MSTILSLITIVVLAILNILPDSPFTGVWEEMDLSYLPTLNWFIPLDTVSTILIAWADCILLFIVFMLVYELIIKIVLQNILKAILAFF